VLRWLAFVELTALAWFVLASRLFRGFPDRGFGLSKTAGLLAVAAVVWLGAAVRVPALSARFALGTLAVLFVLALLSETRRRTTALRDLSWPALAAGELLFLGVFGLVALLRSASPAALGAEKLMDAALVGTLVRAEALPPPDPWLAGHPVNYYYFGALTWATVARATGVPAEVGYNLALATIGAQLAAAAVSIGLALSRRVRAASAGAVVFVAGGNLAAALQWLPSASPRHDLRAPTLAIEGAITEFPFFSLTWGDLHPHLMAAPNVLLATGFLLALLRTRRRGPVSWALALAWGASVGLAWITSMWDVPMLIWTGGLAFAGLAVSERRGRRAGRDAGGATDEAAPQGPRGRNVARLAGQIGLAVAAAAACAAPFLRHFESPGLQLTRAPSNTAPQALLSAQGLVLFLLLVVVAFTWASRGGRNTAAMPSGPDAGADRPARSPWFRRLAAPAPGLVRIALGAAAAVAVGLATRSMAATLLSGLWLGLGALWWRRPRAAPVLLGLGAASALLVPELLVVVEPYGPPFQRLNTVFKLHWHATLLAGPLWAWAMSRVPARTGNRVWRWTTAGAIAVAVAAALAYPVAAVAIRARRAERPLTLDATAYLDSRAPGDAAILDFLAASVVGQPVIVEATTFQYGYAGRISAYSGLPTVIGWSGHERLWRRSAGWAEEIAARERAVAEIYAGPADAVRGHLRRYQVRYVVVGEAERRQYPCLDPRRFEAVGVRVLDRHGASLYEVAR
jgi:YYY domain-containing protein